MSKLSLNTFAGLRGKFTPPFLYGSTVLVGSLDTPNETFLIECLPLDSSSNVNSSIILHTLDDVLRKLGTKRENFALLLTDAARYMSLAGKTLKELYPTLMHVTCVGLAT